MPAVTDVAEAFFTACETGKEWEGCRTYGRPNATFSAQIWTTLPHLGPDGQNTNCAAKAPHVKSGPNIAES